MAALAKWSTFYEIVGTAAASLMGLQFVVVTLIANRPSLRGADANAAFGTPTVVHFGGALLLSAVVCAPWPDITLAAAVWGVGGICGVTYALTVIRRMRTQTVYQPEFEDWLFHALLPLLAYAMLAISAVAVQLHTNATLFAVGGSALLLLFIGIHNAWDSVAYHVFGAQAGRK
jgi:hypothetical protein